MAIGTGSSRLYKEGRAQFIKACEERYSDSKDLEMLRDFLAQQSTPEEARMAAGNLKTDASKKWGSHKVGDTEIPAVWVDKIMANIGNFVAVGNYAMIGAPESVGLAWFAVKLTLSAIQSNYDLYTFFGSGLTDISEIMILIPCVKCRLRRRLSAYFCTVIMTSCMMKETERRQTRRTGNQVLSWTSFFKISFPHMLLC
jgi:hypothetical protein